jgi:hypothetical protein
VSDLSRMAAEAAANAVCTRCGTLMIQPRGANVLTTGTYRRVGGKGTEHFNLCTTCAPLFRLFLAGAVLA